MTSPTEAETLAAITKIGGSLVERVLEPMKRSFIGKDEIIDLMGVCLVAGENLFLLGPPGTAKSALVQELGRRLSGTTFEYLLTRFTEPNELFGPFDIRRLREGELVTNTEGMLPEASLVFLDELLNANSAILNALLGVLNERVFRRGRETRSVPMLMCVGASNRLPEDEALGALFDRFLMRVRCENVPGEQLEQVLAAGWAYDGKHRSIPAANSARSAPHAAVPLEDIRALGQQVSSIDLAAVRRAMADLVLRLRNAGIVVSDRRAVRLQRLVAASAILAGRRRAITSDLWVFRYIWDSVEQQEVLAAAVSQAIGAPGTEEGEHPLARRGDSPDAEALARDLAAISEGPVDTTTADRLGMLAARCQWVRDEQHRVLLMQRVEELWRRIQTNMAS